MVPTLFSIMSDVAHVGQLLTRTPHLGPSEQRPSPEKQQKTGVPLEPAVDTYRKPSPEVCLVEHGAPQPEDPYTQVLREARVHIEQVSPPKPSTGVSPV